MPAYQESKVPSRAERNKKHFDTRLRLVLRVRVGIAGVVVLVVRPALVRVSNGALLDGTSPQCAHLPSNGIYNDPVSKPIIGQ